MPQIKAATPHPSDARRCVAHSRRLRLRLLGALVGALASAGLLASGAGAHADYWYPTLNNYTCGFTGENYRMPSGIVYAATVKLSGPCNWVQVRALPDGPTIAGGNSAISYSATWQPPNNHQSHHWIGWVFLYAGPYYLA